MLAGIVKKYLMKEKNNIDKLANRKSNIKITLMRAFGIIAVVCSHAQGGAVGFPMSNWVHPFFYFMPLFVFVSGFLYKEENDNKNIFRFVLQKAKSLVVPYFVWNLFYGLLNTLFRNVGIINYADKINLYSFFVRPWIDGHQYGFNIPAWFMLSLFIDVVVIFLIRVAFKKMHIFNDIIILVLTYIISICSIQFAKMGYNQGLLLCFIKAGFMLPYFQLGYMCKKFENIISKFRSTLIIGLSLFIGGIVLILPSVHVQVVFGNFYGNFITITALTSSCLLLLMLVCEILEPSFTNNKIVKAIGDNTFSIMMHHAFVIFLINLSIYWLSGIIDISGFDIQQFKQTLWYCYTWKNEKIIIVYVILGVFVPIFVKLLLNKFILLCNNRIETKIQKQKHCNDR